MPIRGRERRKDSGEAMLLRCVGLGLAVLLVCAESARAGVLASMIVPTPLPRQDVFSKNESFVLDVDPDSGRNAVYSVADRTHPLWSFPGALKSDVRRILLADTGSVVVLIGNGEGSAGDPARVEGVRIIDRSGATRSYEIWDFIAKPPLTYGCGPTTLRWFDAVTDHGDRFVIQTPDGKEHSLDYTTAPRLAKWYKVAAAGVVSGVLIFVVGRALLRRAAAKPVDAAAPA
jgi:hypothetical protein